MLKKILSKILYIATFGWDTFVEARMLYAEAQMRSYGIKFDTNGNVIHISNNVDVNLKQ